MPIAFEASALASKSCTHVAAPSRHEPPQGNFFCKLKEFKRIAMRADKTDQSFDAIMP